MNLGLPQCILSTYSLLLLCVLPTAPGIGQRGLFGAAGAARQQDVPGVHPAILGAEAAVGSARRVVELGGREIDLEVEGAVAAVCRGRRGAALWVRAGQCVCVVAAGVGGGAEGTNVYGRTRVTFGTQAVRDWPGAQSTEGGEVREGPRVPIDRSSLPPPNTAGGGGFGAAEKARPDRISEGGGGVDLKPGGVLPRGLSVSLSGSQCVEIACRAPALPALACGPYAPGGAEQDRPAHPLR